MNNNNNTVSSGSFECVPAWLTKANQDFGFWDQTLRVETDPSPEEGAGDSVDPPLGDGGLKALQTEREQRKALEKQLKAVQQQLKAFEGIDPDLAREAKAIAAQQEEWAQKESLLKEEVAAQYQPQVQQAKQEAQAAREALLNYQRDNALEKAFYSADGLPGEFDAVAPALRDRVQMGEKGELKIFDEKGSPFFVKGEPATLSDLLSDVIEKTPWVARHFKGNDSPGFRVNGSGDYSRANPQLSNLPAWERVRLSRQKGA